jgi:hypothetical protein
MWANRRRSVLLMSGSSTNWVGWSEFSLPEWPGVGSGADGFEKETNSFALSLKCDCEALQIHLNSAAQTLIEE